MPYFPLLDFQHLLVSLFLGLLLVLSVYLAWSSYRPRLGEDCSDRPHDPSKVLQGHAEDNPVPLFLVIVYVGIVITAAGYFLLQGFGGGPI
jgi:hypothetical protein